MNSSSFTRRTQSSLFAVIPAQGSGDGSIMVTLTVLPISKSVILPTETHLPVVLRKIGVMTKPMSGMPRTVAQRLARPMQIFSRKRRREISSAETPCASGDEWSAVTLFTENFVDPSGQRGSEEGCPDSDDYPGRDKSPENKCRRHGQTRRKKIWARKTFGW